MTPREGVIIECPLNHLFHDARDVILTSRNDVRQLDNDEPTLGVYDADNDVSWDSFQKSRCRSRPNIRQPFIMRTIMKRRRR